jgi:hypothetical protein
MSVAHAASRTSDTTESVWRTIGSWVVGAKESEVVAASGLENLSEWGGVRSSTTLGTAWLDMGDGILEAVVHDHASVGGDNIAVPVDVGSIGEFGDESLRSSGEDHRRLVGAPGFTSDVADE